MRWAVPGPSDGREIWCGPVKGRPQQQPDGVQTSRPALGGLRGRDCPDTSALAASTSLDTLTQAQGT
jgi:hypothetical protein